MINKRMNYKKHYDLLINRAKSRQLTEYFERHHIVPRCIGGSDNKANIVELTPEEHYVAHQLLVKIYPDNDSLVYAAHRMTTSSKTVKRNNKTYGWLKRKYQSVCKKRVGDKNPSYGKSWYHNPVTLESGKFFADHAPSGWVKGRRVKKIPKTLLFKKINKCAECTFLDRKEDAKKRAEFLYQDLINSGLTPTEYLKQSNLDITLSTFLITLKRHLHYDKNVIYSSKPI